MRAAVRCVSYQAMMVPGNRVVVLKGTDRDGQVAARYRAPGVSNSLKLHAAAASSTRQGLGSNVLASGSG
jgi:hypothetical protein